MSNLREPGDIRSVEEISWHGLYIILHTAAASSEALAKCGASATPTSRVTFCRHVLPRPHHMNAKSLIDLPVSLIVHAAPPWLPHGL